MNHLDAIPVEELLADWGFFLAPLNNGDWMVGRKLYDLEVLSDHYTDPQLSVHSDPRQAIVLALARGLGRINAISPETRKRDWYKRDAEQRADDRPGCLTFWMQYGFPKEEAIWMVSEYSPDQYAKWEKVFPDRDTFRSRFGMAAVQP